MLGDDGDDDDDDDDDDEANRSDIIIQNLTRESTHTDRYGNTLLTYSMVQSPS